MIISTSTKIFVAVVILLCLVLIVACGEDQNTIPPNNQVDIGQGYSIFASSCSPDQPDTRVYTNMSGALFVYADENC